MHPSPNVPFLLAISGVLFIYVEFTRPGKVVPGLIGACLLVVNGYSLWRDSPTPRGLLLIATAAALFLLETFVNTRFVAPAAATVCLAFGAVLLFNPPSPIRPALAFTASIVFGLTTGFLAYAARTARRNKWADLAEK